MTIRWIPAGLPGRIGIADRPRGGDWLADDVARLKADGVDSLVSMLDSGEVAELELVDEERQCAEAGIEFVSAPVPDRGVPEHGQEFRAVAERLLAQVAASRTVAIHCRAGIGRSSLLVATILVLSGASPGDAWTKIAKARGLPVPDTAEQRRWLDSMVLGTRS